MSKLNLPDPIAAYFAADKANAESLANCFTTQGVVTDDGKTHVGAVAIKEWKTAVSAKFSYTSEPFALAQKDGQYIVSSRLTGTFPGSPIDLRYFFRLERGKIAFLEIKP